MADFLVFPLGSSLTGIAAQLSVRLVGNTGDVTGAALTVVESSTVLGLYRAEMVGAAGLYGAVLLRSGGAIASVPTFRWDGTDFVQMTEGDRTTLNAIAAKVSAPSIK